MYTSFNQKENTFYLKLTIIGGFNFKFTSDLFKYSPCMKLPVRILYLNASAPNSS